MRSKTRSIEIHETVPVKPDHIPEGSVFKDYHEYTVQDLVVEPRNVMYLIERWEGPNGEYIVGKLPDHVDGFRQDPEMFHSAAIPSLCTVTNYVK